LLEDRNLFKYGVEVELNLNCWTKEFKGIIWILSNLPVILALIMISCAPPILLQDGQEFANQIVGYAFYLLIIGTLWKLIQYRARIFYFKEKIVWPDDLIE
jgi:hypothetical protein